MKTRVSNYFRATLLAAFGALLLVCPASAQTNFTTLHSFTLLQRPLFINEDGQEPMGGLVVVDGSLYGTALRGGVAGEGTVFQISLDGTEFTTLHSFTNIMDAGSPVARLISSGDVLYGTADFGGPWFKGAVFAINTDGTGFRYLHTFLPGQINALFVNPDGAGPQGRLVLSDNVLYGTTPYGGPFGGGAVFAVNIDGTGFRNLYFFSGHNTTPPESNSDGAAPYGGLVLVGQTLYGTTLVGGQAGVGTIFAINIDGTGFTTLYTFTNNADGAMPFAGLTLSGATLYGVTSSGGSGYAGTVFAFGLDWEGFRVLHSFPPIPLYPGPFTNSEGAIPHAALALSENADKLYGVASSGGAFASGALFAINTDGTGFTNLYSFTALPPFAGGSAPTPTNGDGAQPLGELVVLNGELFGTAAQGGVAGNGTIFRFALPPSILVQPVDRTATVGDNVTFKVVADGAGPLDYQWRFHEINISGANGPALMLNNVQLADAGAYSVRVFNGVGSVDSAAAILTVVPPPNRPPVANSQSVSLNENASLLIVLGAFDPEGDPLTYAVTAPSHGTLTGTAPNLTYKPASNYFGPDSFSFTVNDGKVDSALAAVSITVLQVNHAPVAEATLGPLVNLSPLITNLQIISVNGSNATVILDGSKSTDADGDPLQYSWSANGVVVATGVLTSNIFDVGTYTITLTVSDALSSGADSLTVDIIPADQATDELASLVDQSLLDRRTKRPLGASVKSALVSLTSGNLQAGINQLQAFQNKVRAQVAPGDPVLAENLIQAAQAIVNVVSGP